MPKIPSYVSMVLSLCILTGCGTTRRFVDQPHLTIDDPQKDVRQAIGELFGLSQPYTVKFCEADPSSKQCKTQHRGIAATGVGGLFLPLILHVKGMDMKRHSQSADGLAFDASINATVDAISPLCATVTGKIVSRDNNTASMQLSNFYCNWVVVGNVLVNADLSIDSINLRDRVLTGYYKLTFHGTGNASGSGYYKAIITPKST
jgi:hypothetical protein